MLQLRNLIWRLSNQGTGLREGMSQECIHQLSPNPLYKILPHVRSGRSYCYVMHMIQSLNWRNTWEAIKGQKVRKESILIRLKTSLVESENKFAVAFIIKTRSLNAATNPKTVPPLWLLSFSQLFISLSQGALESGTTSLFRQAHANGVNNMTARESRYWNSNDSSTSVNATNR